jgi:hypothetical protein
MILKQNPMPSATLPTKNSTCTASELKFSVRCHSAAILGSHIAYDCSVHRHVHMCSGKHEVTELLFSEMAYY